MDPVKVLFVCMGNICRSPAGEGVFKHFLDTHGHAGKIMVDSAGTIGYHSGNPADPRMREAAKARGYRLESIARQITSNDINEFDLIIAMDEDNLWDIEALSGKPASHIRMLGTFLQEYGGQGRARSVPDPYYGGADGFEKVLDMIEQACPQILQHCLSLHATRQDDT